MGPGNCFCMNLQTGWRSDRQQWLTATLFAELMTQIEPNSRAIGGFINELEKADAVVRLINDSRKANSVIFSINRV